MNARTGTRRGQGGFTVVEVIIAALLLTAVMSAIGFAFMGGTRLQGQAKLQASLTDAGKRVNEHLASNRSWMEQPGCRSLSSPCGFQVETASAACAGGVTVCIHNLPTDLLEARGLGSSFVLRSASSQAIDSDADGTADADRDGLVPDYYRIELVIGLPPDLLTRYGQVPDRTFVVTIDRRGDIQKGSLVVEVCKVLNQADDRMAVQGCPQGAAGGIKMAGCSPQPRFGCLASYGWVDPLPKHVSNPSPFVMLERVPMASISFTVRNVMTNQTWPSSSAVHEGGVYTFQDLPTGPYRLEGLPGSLGANFERWKLREVPAWHGSTTAPVDSSIVVEAGLRNRALVLFRPKPTSGLNLYFDRRTRNYRINRRPIRFEETIPESAGQPVAHYSGSVVGDTCDSYQSLIDALNSIGGYSLDCVILQMNAGATDTSPNCRKAVLTFNGEEIHAVVACMFYKEWMHHTYYTRTGPFWQTRVGAAEGATYAVEPRPDNRVVIPNATDFDVPRAECVVQWKTQCASPITALMPGLNSPLIKTPGTNPASIAINEQFPTNPAWADGANPAPLWVRPDGGIVTPGPANQGVNPMVHFRGLGECYWENPDQFAGEQIGSCDPCEPLWKLGSPNWELHNACGAIVTHTKLCRLAWEIFATYADQSGVQTGATEYLWETTPRCIDRDFDPPLVCTNNTPVLNANSTNCQPGNGPPASNPCGGCDPTYFDATQHRGRGAGESYGGNPGRPAS